MRYDERMADVRLGCVSEEDAAPVVAAIQRVTSAWDIPVETIELSLGAGFVPSSCHVVARVRLGQRGVDTGELRRLIMREVRAEIWLEMP